MRRRREAGPGTPPEAGRRRGPRPLPRPLTLGRASRPQTHPSRPPRLRRFPPGLDLLPLRTPSAFPRRSVLGTLGHPLEHVVLAKPFIYSLLHIQRQPLAPRVPILDTVQTSPVPGVCAPLTLVRTPLPHRNFDPHWDPS